jgi:hypothetical protein
VAWAFVQKKDSAGATAVFASNTTTGNQIIVVNNCVAGATSVSISPGSGTFTKIVSLTIGGGGSEIWLCPNVTGGTTPTVTVTGGTAPGPTCYEFSGGDHAGATDGTNSNSGATAALSTGSITTGTSGDLVVKGFSCTAIPNGTAESGWTETNPNLNNNVAGFIIQSAAGAITGTDTALTTGNWEGVIAAFKVASGSVNPSGTGSVHVTGVTNLPAAIPQLTGSILVTGVTNLPAAIPQLTGSLSVTGLLKVALSTNLTGSILVTGATNLPAAIPQLTGSWGITGVTNLPAAIPQLTGSINVTGLVNPSIAPQVTGLIKVTGVTNLPAAILQLTGSIIETGLFSPSLAPTGLTGAIVESGLFAPGIAVPLSGTILVTGTTSLSSLSLTGSLGVTGLLVPGLSVPLTGAIITSGLLQTGITPPGLSGSIIETGLFKPTLAPSGLAGNLGVVGTAALIFSSPFLNLNLVGFVTVTGNLSLSFQSTIQPVMVSASGIYITLTVDNSYWITYLLAGVDYSTWIKTVMSGPYVAIGRTMAYDVAVQELYAEIGSSS